jgi:putative ABC transport system permease protein
MRTLWRKLFRTIVSTKGQFFAVLSVIAVGITLYVAMTAVSENLIHSKDLFYAETSFADHFFHVVNAPEGIGERIKAVKGVLAATARTQKDVPVLWEGKKRANLRLTGYPMPDNGELNRVKVIGGRMFDKYPKLGAVEVLINRQFAEAHKLKPGMDLDVAAEGKRKVLTIVGIAASPEFVYTVRDAAGLLEDPSTFGAAIMPENQIQELLDRKGSVNQVLIRFAPGAQKEEIVQKIKEILQPYGLLAEYPQKDQLSEAILRGELTQLRAFSRFLPTIFLAIALLMQFVFVGRLVKTQRGQIGLLKALGYSNISLLFLYGSYAFLATTIGAFVGIALGYGLASLLVRLYSIFFNLPRLEETLRLGTAGAVAFLSITAGTTAGLAAAWGITSIRPAESMRPTFPKATKRSFLERIPILWNHLGLQWRMSFRSLSRSRLRAFVTAMGAIFSIALLVVSLFSKDSMDDLMRRHFSYDRQYDYLVRIISPVKEGEILNISRIDGVLEAEPFLELPVRIKLGRKNREDVLLAMEPSPSLVRITNQEGKELPLPEEGLLLDWFTAQKLEAKVGDELQVQSMLDLGPPRYGIFRVEGITKRAMGSASMVSLKEANRLLNEQNVVSGVMLKIDPGLSDKVERELERMVNISSVLNKKDERAYFQKNLGYMYYSIGILVLFSSVLGFAIIYNSSVIALSERKRTLAALKALGMTNQEVAVYLWGEDGFLLLWGIILGLPLGKVLSELYAVAVSTDLFSFNVIIYKSTYFLAACGGIVLGIFAWILALKGVKELEMIEILKAND